ncbi:hypothetical protein K3U93_12645 [Mycobacterium malmoense]|uniref:PE-PGRS family protein n=1 Tax=Mycobacterium malmoense TaxID=1780 RepID=A0ABX3SWM6_MYCMA|nr:hypothetical protein [Mycobacterium malmoense]ORA84669.1 hypothetical protein BST29_03590 [Mycobacterium malmoense]QZA15636.1 hypothetical protein K3U93_12645 [Mycobacterium malmoense]UNB92450.1 hypothetical protein H5T25_12635 [Mycobacterium malmoense]
MQQLAALRPLQPLVAAGAAAVGASLIALTPAVSTDFAADLQHSAAAVQQRAVALTSSDPGVVNPIQTWIDVFQDSAANLQAIGNQWAQIPAVLAQQVAANWVEYADTYVSSYQEAAQGGIDYFLGTDPTDFVPKLVNVGNLLQAANFPAAFDQLSSTFWTQPISALGLPLFPILKQIPVSITQNLANVTNYLMDDFVEGAGINFLFEVPVNLAYGLGIDVQNVYDAFSAGDLPAGLTNLVNFPGAFAGQVLNGFTYNGANWPGLLSFASSNPSDGGVLQFFLNAIPSDLAQVIVAPGAANIVGGQSLSGVVQAFLSTLTNFGPTGWPTPQVIGDSFLNLVQTYFGGPNFASAANVASVADFAAAASAAGALPADLPGIAPSIAADLSGLAPSVVADLASRLPVEFGTLAANVLTSLF